MRACVISMMAAMALTLALGVSGPAQADDAARIDLPPIDGPDQWHLMTHDDATSTSQCIGDPKTPLCAIETVLACFLRHNDHLCRIGTGNPDFPEGIKSIVQPAYTQRYWVAAAEFVTANKPSYAKVRYLKPHVGDIAVRIHDAPCYDQKCYKPVGPPAIYLVRRNGDKWMVADKAVPSW
ncbi:MAG: hypothetical protein OEL53_13270 [Rhodospirillales bacterium]|nr:hypothetical protein [Rhodospirillales bacterium]